jgi:hypothetical protein
VFVLFWSGKLFHLHCFKPCFRIWHSESPIRPLRFKTDWENSISYYVDEYIPSGNINTVKKNTANLLVTIEEHGLKWNTGKCKYLFRKKIYRALHIVMEMLQCDKTQTYERQHQSKLHERRN